MTYYYCFVTIVIAAIIISPNLLTINEVSNEFAKILYSVFWCYWFITSTKTYEVHGYY